MGGSGSGRWCRYSKKDTTGGYLDFSINFLKRHNKLEEGMFCSGAITWSRGGNETGSIGYKIDTLDEYAPKVTLRYNHKDEPLEYPICLTTTTPNYGGVRWWFICPANGCSRRVGFLYGGRIFACRHCYNLSYDSQNEAIHSRMLTKAQKIHKKLGGSGCTMDYVSKPKGMHWKTYNRLKHKMDHYDNASMMMVAKKFGMIDGF
jgi:hypothetical protein